MKKDQMGGATILVIGSENVAAENKMSLDKTWRSSAGSQPITARLLEPAWNMRLCDWPNSNRGGSSSADWRFG